ncbi:metallophosphoesterase [Thiovibrio sp. JS02]
MRYLGFFSVFFLLYGAMHVYGLRVLGRACPGLRPWRWALLCLPLVLSPMLVRFLERMGFEAIALPLAWGAYLWMGFFFLFVVNAAALDFLWAVCRLAASVMPGGRRQDAWTAGGRFWLPLVAAAGISLYAWQEARQPILEEVTIVSGKIPAKIEEIRVVQLSDLHLGLLTGEKRLAGILALVRAARPDILVGTGDLVDGQTGRLNGLTGLFREIPAPLGKYAVLGNHEWYAGVAQSVTFLEAAGFTVLRDEARDVAGLLVVAGIDDARTSGAGAGKSGREEKLLRLLPGNIFRLYLKHRPLPPAHAGDLCDLQLSGHVHKGQIFPFGFLVRRVFPFPTGLIEVAVGKYLYTSRGAGTWGPPLRFLAPPEVTLIRLRPAPG